MKEFNKAGLHILFWITIPLLILYFKWAAQDTTTLPGLPIPESESFFEIVRINIDVIIVSLLGSIPAFYWSLFCLTPKLLFKTNYIKILLYPTGLIAYFFIVSLITELIFPMYFFLGTPYAIKILAPIVLLSALSGTLFAFMEKLQEKKL
jgi:hypothetical protein